LAKFKPQRHSTTIIGLAVEGLATVTDEIIELHERIIGLLFATARNKHRQQLQVSAKTVVTLIHLTTAAVLGLLRAD
jgi:hypothetical protein